MASGPSDRYVPQASIPVLPRSRAHCIQAEPRTSRYVLLLPLRIAVSSCAASRRNSPTSDSSSVLASGGRTEIATSDWARR